MTARNISKRKGIFITGTDTGVGKTIVAGAIIRGLINIGHTPGVMKPVETGCRRESCTLIPEDGLFLKGMAGVDTPLDEVTPYRYETPVAPSVASALEGGIIDEAGIQSVYKRLFMKHGFMVVEGIGGIMVPLRDDLLVLDLIKALNLPLVIVARNTLGVLNHTLLTLKAARDAGIEIAGFIINHTGPSAGSMAERTNPETLRSLLDIPFIGVFPFIEEPGVTTLEKAAIKSLNINAILYETDTSTSHHKGK